MISATQYIYLYSHGFRFSRGSLLSHRLQANVSCRVQLISKISSFDRFFSFLSDILASRKHKIALDLFAHRKKGTYVHGCGNNGGGGRDLWSIFRFYCHHKKKKNRKKAVLSMSIFQFTLIGVRKIK